MMNKTEIYRPSSESYYFESL